jgi:hypothetical protein
MIENEVHMSNEYKYSLKEFSEYLGKSEIEILQMVSMGELIPEVYVRVLVESSPEIAMTKAHIQNSDGLHVNINGGLFDQNLVNKIDQIFLKKPEHIPIDIATRVLNSWLLLPPSIFQDFWLSGCNSTRIYSLPLEILITEKNTKHILGFELPKITDFFVYFDPAPIITLKDIWFTQSEVKKTRSKKQSVKTRKSNKSNPELGLIFWRAFKYLENDQSSEPQYKQVWETVYDEVETERQLNEPIPKKRTYDPHEHILTIDSIDTPTPKLNWLIGGTNGRVIKQGTFSLSSLPSMMTKLKRTPPKI